MVNGLPIYDLNTIGGVKKQDPVVQKLIGYLNTNPIDSQMLFCFPYDIWNIYLVCDNGILGHLIGYDATLGILNHDPLPYIPYAFR